MTSLGMWPTTPAFAWLATILRERWGVSVSLSVESPGTLSLKVPNESGSVSFDLDVQMFATPAAEMDCGRWRAATEGFGTGVFDELPTPGMKAVPHPLVRPTATGYHVGYDVFGLLYWMLARIEEIGSSNHDVNGRFPATAAHAYRHGYLTEPIVDRWIAVLRAIVERRWPRVAFTTPRFRVAPSHDVDRPFQYLFVDHPDILRQVAGDVVKRRDPRLAIRRYATWRAIRAGQESADPFNTFDWIMAQSHERGLTSLFYFLCGGRDPDRDADFAITHLAVQRLLRSIHRSGHDIGLHPSYTTFQDPAQLAREFEALRTACEANDVRQSHWGARMHYLRWRHPETLCHLDALGLAHDGTMGYADQVGFRAGTCHEYPAFDPVAQRPMAIRIRPLIVMDDTIMTYMRLGTSAEAKQVVQQLRRTCHDVGGTFSVLWHNSNLVLPAERALYLTALDGEVTASHAA